MFSCGLFQRLPGSALLGAYRHDQGSMNLKPNHSSDAAQKLLPPVVADTGVAIATNSLHNNFGHVGANVNLYPDFSHHVASVHVDFANDASRNPACFGDTPSQRC
jgi:hypothetical protein